MFAKLANVRRVLASVQMVNVEPATVDALREAIEELDDAMVMEFRALSHVRDNPSPTYNEQYANAGIC